MNVFAFLKSQRYLIFAVVFLLGLLSGLNMLEAILMYFALYMLGFAVALCIGTVRNRQGFAPTAVSAMMVVLLGGIVVHIVINGL